MKQFNYLMFAGALCLAACAERPDLLGGGGVGLSDNQISFSTNTVNGWQGLSGGSRAAVAANENGPLKMESSLGHPLYLHPIEQAGTYIYNSKDELITRSGAPLPNDGNLLRAEHHDAETRGAKYTDASLTNAFGVSAVLTNTTNNTNSSYFQNLKATPNGGSWITNEPKYWPTDGSLSFYAYYPYSTDSHNMLSEDATGDVNKTKIVHYVAATSADGIIHQPDLIVANHPNVTRGSKDAPTSVDLIFSHVLTAITFAVGSDMVPGTVKSIAIKGVKNTGDYDLSTGKWTTSGNDADFKIDLGNGQGKAVTGKQDEALTTGAQTLMMIPQTFDASSKAKVEIVFTPTNGQDKTLSASLANTSWDAGSTIIYKVSTSSLQPVLTTVKATFPTDWSDQKEYANKLKSAYVKDDKLGLYVVSQDGRVKAANVEVTFNGTSWTLANQSIHFNVNDRFFAYSPYTADTKLLQGMPNVSTIVTADKLASSHAFFKGLEDAWAILPDQSTRANFDASDLLVSTNTHINNTGSGIDITMVHAMGLADITLGQGLNYALANSNHQIDTSNPYSWTSAIVSDKFVDKKPYGVSCNRYVAVVKPNVPTTFNATASGWKCAWKSPLSFNLTASASIEKQTASRTDVSNHPYTLALGDIYYTNGAVTHQSDDLEPVEANPPIGIVVYIGQNKWTEYQTGSGHGGHALVADLKDFDSAFDSQYRNSTISKDYANSINDIKDPDAITSGYVVTKRFSQVSNGYEAFKLVDNATVNPCQAPANKSTGWFVPSIGQWYAFFIGLGGLNPDGWSLGAETRYNYQHAEPEIQKKLESIFRRAGKDYYFINNKGYGPVTWAASDSPYASFGFFADLSSGYFVLAGNGTKYHVIHVRPFLAF